MNSQGRQRMNQILFLVFGLLVGSLNSYASSLTVRDIQLKPEGGVQIQLDGVAPRGSLEIEYVRDIVQFSIQNATIYPAKILHADAGKQGFNKVFAYQYAPNLVRVRFSVDGQADQFKGKVKWEQKAKLLSISFPILSVKNQESDSHEKSLLAKVLGQSNDVKVEKIDDAGNSAKPSSEAKVETKPETKKEREHRLTGSNHQATASAPLGGAKNSPSVFRSFLALFLVVGGLGMVLLYVKRKKSGAQASRVGDSWLSNLIPGSMKNKRPLIEVIANHSLGAKQSITVVRIRGQQFVLGVTQDSVQLITQLDADDSEVGVLDDPKVADSIGKMFGSKPKVANTEQQADLGSSFNALLKSSSGAGAIVARNAYQAQTQSQGRPATPPPVVAQALTQNSNSNAKSSVRDQIKQRLQGMKNV